MAVAGRRDPRDRVLHAQARHGAVLLDADDRRRPGARPARSPRALDEQGIAYELRSNGTALAVDAVRDRAGARRARRAGPRRRRHAARASSSSTSRSSAPPTSSSRSPTSARWRARSPARSRASQGVTGAQVQLVLPEDDLFADAATAGQRGRHARRLRRHARARRGARHRPARRPPRVKGLKTDKRDDHRRDRPAPVAAGRRRHRRRPRGATKQAAEASYERGLEANLNAMLARTLGPGKAQVQVNADLNVDKTTLDKLEYAKSGTPLEARRRRPSALARRRRRRRGGAAGTGAEHPDLRPGRRAAAATPTTSASRARPTSASTRPSSKTEVAPGTVKKLERRADGRQDGPRRDGRPAAEDGRRRAAGVDTERGDAFQAAQLAFAKPPPSRRPARCRWRCSGRSKWAGLGLATLLFLFFMMRHLRKRESETLAEPAWLTRDRGPDAAGRARGRATACRPTPGARRCCPRATPDTDLNDSTADGPRARARRGPGPAVDERGLMSTELAGRAGSRPRVEADRAAEGRDAARRARRGARERALQAPRRDRDRAALARDRQVAQGRPHETCRRSISEAVETVIADALRRRGRRRLRPRACSSARSARSARRRSSAASRPRSSAGRSSSCAARRRSRSTSSCATSRRRRSRSSSPTCTPTLAAEVLEPARRRPAGRGRPPRRHHVRDAAGGRRRGRVGHARTSSPTSSRRSTRRPAACSRSPRSSTRPTARPSATCSTSSRDANAELAEEVRLLLFTFEDIAKLDDRAIQLVLKEVDQKDLAIALRGVAEDVAREDLREHVRARRRAAARGDRVPAAAAAARRRGGAGPHRRRRAPPRGHRRDRRSRAAPAAARTSSSDGRRVRLRRRSRPRRRRSPPAGAVGAAPPTPCSRRSRSRTPRRTRPRAAARDEGSDGRPPPAEALARSGPPPPRWSRPLAALAASAAATPSALEAQAVDLALCIAEKVVGGALAVEPERVLEAVRGALRALVERERVTVLVHPDDLELVARVDRRDRGRRSAASSTATCRPSAASAAAAPSCARPRARSTPASRPSSRARARWSRRRWAPHDGSRTALDRAADALRDADLQRRHGRVRDLIGLIVEATGLEAEVGEVCTIDTGRGRAPVPAEVVGFRAGRTLLMAARRRCRHRPGRDRERHRAPAARRGLRRAARPGARRPRPPDRRPRTRGGVAGYARAPSTAPPPDPLARPRIDERVDARRARAGHARALRARPAPRHLRRLRRRQVHAARA